MSDELKTIREVGEIVSVEGLEYAIMDYLSPEKIQDSRLRELWKKAREAVKEVDSYIEDILGEDYRYE